MNHKCRKCNSNRPGPGCGTSVLQSIWISNWDEDRSPRSREPVGSRPRGLTAPVRSGHNDAHGSVPYGWHMESSERVVGFPEDSDAVSVAWYEGRIALPKANLREQPAPNPVLYGSSNVYGLPGRTSVPTHWVDTKTVERRSQPADAPSDRYRGPPASI